VSTDSTPLHGARWKSVEVFSEDGKKNNCHINWAAKLGFGKKLAHGMHDLGLFQETVNETSSIQAEREPSTLAQINGKYFYGFNPCHL
jgi:hypothetical protein